MGAISVTISTTGDDISGGFTVTVDGDRSRTLGANGSETFTDVAAGSHIVTLTNIASNCSVSGSNPVTVTVTAGSTTRVVIFVTCIFDWTGRIAPGS